MQPWFLHVPRRFHQFSALLCLLLLHLLNMQGVFLQALPPLPARLLLWREAPIRCPSLLVSLHYCSYAPAVSSSGGWTRPTAGASSFPLFQAANPPYAPWGVSI